jgi:hypothetical protein
MIRYDGKVWIVTTEGSDFARGTLRPFSSTTAVSCYALQNVPRLTATAAEMAVHAKGATLGC